MPETKLVAPRRDPLPEDFGSLDEFWAFWDAHSSADYEDQMEAVESQNDRPSSCETGRIGEGYPRRG